MTEQIQDQISAFIDDELTSGECAFLVRRLERDPESRNKLIRYATIGAALRNEMLWPEPGVLLRRVRQAINDGVVETETTAGAAASVQPATRTAAGGRGQLRPAIAAGIAAGVALAAVLILYAGRDGSIPEAGLQAGATEPQAAQPMAVPAARQRPSYEVAQSSPARPPIRLTNYLVHHGEYATGVSRTSVHSNVIGSQEVREAGTEPGSWE